MAKKVITKKALIKEAKTGWRYRFGLIFIFVTLFATIISVIETMKPETLSIENIIGTICFDIFLIIVFGWCIGLKTILRARMIAKKINSSDFIIEIDEVIDKFEVNNSLNNSCRAVFKYNEVIFPISRWDEFKKGSKYYIFNFPKNETIVKKVSCYELDDELKKRLVDYHVNEENSVEKWED